MPMSGRIPQTFIDDLLSRVDIVEVIGEHLSLRKVGANYQALCPFHTERTPSFSVNREKQFFHCFGCGKGGSVLRFTMDYLRLDFAEAVGRLADRAGLEVVPGIAVATGAGTNNHLYELLGRVAQFYAKQLRDPRTAARAIAYLKDRGLDGRTAARYGLGYAPPGWDHLLREFGDSTEGRQMLELSGLLIRKDGSRCYDRFRDRIMFPIRDLRGRVAGFGGRTVDGGEPKYLNSPETPVFRKGAELYGLSEALGDRAKPEQLMVVEGYMDALALAQHGLRNTVATLGTALTREHLSRLFRITNKVVFCFDGDEAGRRAAWRALELSLPELQEDRSVGFVFLPAGEDPDSWVRKAGIAPFADPQRVTPLSDFMLDRLAGGIDLETIEGRAALAERARPLLAAVASRALQGLLVRRVSELSGLSVDEISSLMRSRRAWPGERVRTAPTTGPGVGKLSAPSVIDEAIRFLLHRPELASRMRHDGDLTGHPEPRAGLLMRLLRYAREHPGLSCAAILEAFSGDTEGDWLSRLAAQDVLLSDAKLEAEFFGAIERIDGLTERHRRKELAQATGHSLAAVEPADLRRRLRLERRGRNEPEPSASGNEDY